MKYLVCIFIFYLPGGWPSKAFWVLNQMARWDRTPLGTRLISYEISGAHLCIFNQSYQFKCSINARININHDEFLGNWLTENPWSKWQRARTFGLLCCFSIARQPWLGKDHLPSMTACYPSWQVIRRISFITDFHFCAASCSSRAANILQ